MKSTRKVLSLMLVLILILAIAIPVAALGSEWRYEFRNQFPLLSQGSSKTGYISALQRFLSVHTSSSSAMASAGGIDGAYGAGTANAVKLFQTYASQNLIYGMSVDGIAGGDTWAAVAMALSESSNYLKCGSYIVMKKDTYNGESALYYNKSGAYYYFHTIVGDIPEY